MVKQTSFFNQLHLYLESATMQLESSRRPLYTPLYEKQLFESRTSQWRLLFFTIIILKSFLSSSKNSSTSILIFRHICLLIDHLDHGVPLLPVNFHDIAAIFILKSSSDSSTDTLSPSLVTIILTHSQFSSISRMIPTLSTATIRFAHFLRH